MISILDVVVLIGAVLVALVTAIVLQLQLGLGWQLATVAGLAVFAIAATLHIVLQRTEEVSTLRAQIQTLERELAAVRGPQLGPQQTSSSTQIPASVMLNSMPAPNLAPGAGPIHEAGPSQRRRAPEPPPLELDEEMDVSRRPMPQRPAMPVPRHPEQDPAAGWGEFQQPQQSSMQGPSEFPPDSGWLPLSETSAGMPDEPSGRQSAASPALASRDARAFDRELEVDAPTTPTVLVRPAARPLAPEAPELAEPRRTVAAPTPAPEGSADKATGLLAGISSRLGRQKSTVEQSSPVPAARQRVVRGWQEGAPEQVSKPAGPPAAPVTATPASTAPLQQVRPRAPHKPSTPARHPADNPAISMPPPADAPPPASSAGDNPVDALIHSIARRLAAESEGVTTEALLALPAPDPDAVSAGTDYSGEPMSAQASARAAAIRTAVEAGRVEVHLQPILALDGLSTVSYEAFPRLRDGTGALIKPEEYYSFAHRAGLSAGIEKLALLRTIHVLQQLDARGKLSPIFINVSQELLSDGRFFATFVEAMKGTRNLSHNLVLEFAQPIAAVFGDRDLESLDTLARLGFTFALDDVDHVEMDFEPLITRGLAFVKVAPGVLQQGLFAGEAVIPPDEIKVLFEDAGLQIIAHRLTQEADLETALALSMTFGQGGLFAEPKPVKAEVLHEAAGRAA